MSSLTPLLGLTKIDDSDDAEVAVRVHHNSDVTILDQAVLLSASQALTNKTLNGALVAGNLQFTGTGRRIQADFSNGTHANRTMFQTSTANGNTVVGAIPNGTGSAGSYIMYGGSDPANAPVLQLVAATSGNTFSSSFFGSGVLQPVSFVMNATTLIRMHTSLGLSLLDATDPGAGVASVAGNLSITGASRRIIGDFGNATHANRVLFQTSITNGNTILGVIPNGTGVATSINFYALSDTANTPVISFTATSTGHQINSSHFGTGSDQPLTVQVAGGNVLRFHVSGGVSVLDTTDPGAGALRIGGRVGIATSPRAWDAGSNTLDLGPVGIRAAGDSVLLVANGYYSGSAYVTPAGGAIGAYASSSGYHAWYNSNSLGVGGSVASLTERMRLLATGALMLGVSSNAKQTVGLTIQMGANTDEIVSLKSSSVAHGITTQTETDTFGMLRKTSNANGGVHLVGASSATGGVTLSGWHSTDDTSRNNSSNGCIYVNALLKSGTTVGAIGGTANLIVFANNGTVRFMLDGQGDSFQDVGTAWTNFHGHDDVALLSALSGVASRRDDPLRAGFLGFVASHRAALEGAGIATVNDGPGGDGSVFVNWSRTKMLMIGAIQQLGDRLAAAADRIAALEARLALNGG